MIEARLYKQVDALCKELQQFSQNIQNNINVGALRVASNVVKDEIHAIPFETVGDKGVYEKHLKKSRIAIRKRRRTPSGWDRFKIFVRREEQDLQERNKSWYYNIITNSKERMRYTKANKKRGVLKRDPFMQKATDKAERKALRGYIFYMRSRILADGAKISAKTINNAKKRGF